VFSLLAILSLAAQPPTVLLVMTVSQEDAPLLLIDPAQWIATVYRRPDTRPPEVQAFALCATRDKVPASIRCRAMADFDGDGDVDMNDHGMFQRVTSQRGGR
jgi:hypothetical protein